VPDFDWHRNGISALKAKTWMRQKLNSALAPVIAYLGAQRSAE
jgi:hypothetical protein